MNKMLYIFFALLLSLCTTHGELVKVEYKSTNTKQAEEVVEPKLVSLGRYCSVFKRSYTENSSTSHFVGRILSFAKGYCNQQFDYKSTKVPLFLRHCCFLI